MIVRKSSTSSWRKASAILVIPIVVVSILGATVGQGDRLDDLSVWLLVALVMLMAICLLMARRMDTRDRRRTPDVDGVG